MKSKRFVVRDIEQVPELAAKWGLYLGKDACHVLVDTSTNEVVGDDRKSIRDLSLVRDMDWIPYLLNEQQTELDKAIEALGYAVSCLQGEPDKLSHYAKDKAWLEDRKKVIDAFYDLIGIKK